MSDSAFMRHTGYGGVITSSTCERYLRILLLTTCLCIIAHLPGSARAVYISGSKTAHAQYPKWNACVNASISFEFKTATTTQEEALLMYVADGGTFDFIQVRKGRDLDLFIFALTCITTLDKMTEIQSHEMEGT